MILRKFPFLFFLIWFQECIASEIAPRYNIISSNTTINLFYRYNKIGVSDNSNKEVGKIKTDTCPDCIQHVDNKNKGDLFDLLNIAAKHLETERNYTQHVELIKADKEVVAATSYILLLEVAPTTCPKDMPEAARAVCSINTQAPVEICEIKIAKQLLLNKPLNVTSNNCTKSQTFSLSDKSAANITDDKSTGSALSSDVENFQPRLLLKESVNDTETDEEMSEETETPTTEKESSEEETGENISLWQKKKRLKRELKEGTFDEVIEVPILMKHDTSEENSEETTTKPNTSASVNSLEDEEGRRTSRRINSKNSNTIFDVDDSFEDYIGQNMKSAKLNSAQEEVLISNLAKLVAARLDAKDWTNYRHVVLDVKNRGKFQLEGTIHNILVKLAKSKCKKNKVDFADEDLLKYHSNKDDKDCIKKTVDRPVKVCEVQIHLTEEHTSPKFLKLDCGRYKRQASLGGKVNVSLDDATVVELAKNTVSLYDGITAQDNKYKVIEIMWASSQVVSGLVYDFGMKIALSDCQKTDSKPSKDCGNLLGAKEVLCEVSVWTRNWIENGTKATIQCGDDHPHYFWTRRFVKDRDETLPGGIQSISTDYPKVLELVEHTLTQMDKESTLTVKYVASEILAASEQTVSGVRYSIDARIGPSDCLKTDSRDHKYCKVTPNEIPQLCNIKIWDRPWLPHGRETNVTCNQSTQTYRTRRSVGSDTPGGIRNISVRDPKVLELVEHTLTQMDKESTLTVKYVASEILAASEQTVSGVRYSIDARIGPSDCLKTDSRDHKYCKVTPNEIPPLCSIKIWDRPWLPHGRETNVTCNQSTQTYRTRRSVGNDTLGGIRNISVRDPKVLELVEHTLTQMDKESTLTVKYVASEILAASEETVSGVRYSIDARIGPSDCLKTDSRDHKYCKVTPNEIPPLCSIKIWDRPWLPHGRETNVTCNQSTQTYRTRRSVGNDTPGGIRNISVRDPKVLELVEHTLTQMDKESTLTVKYVASEILAASEQTVSGVRYSIDARIGTSDCLKTDSRDHKYCKVTPNEIPQLCNIKIWDRPWLPHGRETNVTCNQSTQTYRTRRSVGNDTLGGIRNISVRDPKVLELVEHTLTQMDKESTLTVKYVASEILAASEQTVSGVRYSIDTRIGPSDCLKTDSRDHKYCKVTPNEIPQLCNIKIWDRPWLPHGRETNVTCNQSTQTYRTRRSVGSDTPGGIRNISVRDPKVLELVEHTLTQMDKESTLTVKYVASEILAASEQTVSGVRYSIDARIGPSDCLKTDSRDHKYCKVTPNEIPQLCNIKIWDRPWLPHGRETNVTCNQSTQTYRTRRSVGSDTPGGIRNISVRDPKVLELVEHTLTQMDKESTLTVKYVASEILAASEQTVSGVRYSIDARIGPSDCLKTDSRDHKYCKVTPNEIPPLCSIKIWDRPWLPHGRETNVTCNQSTQTYRTRRSVGNDTLGGIRNISVRDPKVLELVEHTLTQMDKESTLTVKYVASEILAASEETVSGVRYSIDARIGPSDCLKTDSRDHKYCKVTPNEIPPLCSIKIWDRPWLPHGRETNVTCNQSTQTYRTRRSVGNDTPGGIRNISVRDPKVLELVEHTLTQLDKESTLTVKYVASEILAASEQTVSGVRYSIDARIGTSDCLKTDSRDHKYCKVTPNEIPQLCNIKIWDRPWLPHGRETNVTCNQSTQTYRTRRSVGNDTLGGIRNISVRDPKVLELVEHTLTQMDKESTLTVKYVASEILAASEQTVSGVRYSIDARIGPSDCLKTDSRDHKYCKVTPNEIPQLCNIKIWDRPWLPHGRETNVTCNQSTQTYRTRRSVGSDTPGGIRNISVRDPKVLELVEHTLTQMDKESTLTVKYVASEILAASEQTVSGVRYSIDARIGPSDCLKTDSRDHKYCKVTPNEIPPLCSIKIWDRPWLPHGRETNVTCNQSTQTYRTRRSVGNDTLGGIRNISVRDPKVLELVEHTLTQMDKESTLTVKYVASEILAASEETVSGVRYSIDARIGPSDCLKTDSRDHKYCKVTPNEIPPLCSIKIWDRPWLPHGRETNVTCNQSTQTYRTRRSVGNDTPGGIRNISVRDPKVLELVEHTLTQMDKESTLTVKYVASEILAASEQTVSGVRYSIDARIGTSDCLKTDSRDHKYCKVTPNEIPQLCNIKIWDRPWLPHGRETNVTCNQSTQTYRTRRSVGNDTLGGIRNISVRDPKVLELVEHTLTQMDKESTLTVKYVASEILSASRQVVSGVLYNIDARIAPSDCLKTDSRARKYCNATHNEIPPLCNIKIWDRPWLPHGRETNVTCNQSTQTYRTRRSVGNDTLGGIRNISVRDPKVLELVEHTLTQMDKESTLTVKYVASEILAASEQTVSGVRYSIDARIGPSDCLKTDSRDHKYCKVTPNEIPPLCSIKIWDRPWLPHGRETNVTCNQSTQTYRTRRSVGNDTPGGIRNISVRDPKVLELVEHTLTQMDKESTLTVKYVASEILAASEQTVSGVRYSIDARIGPSDCLKTDSRDHKYCKVTPNEIPQLCNIKIWDRPWLPHGRETNVTCNQSTQTYRTRRSVGNDTPGGIRNISVRDPKVLELVEHTLTQMDKESTLTVKYVASEILAASEQTVSGVRYSIDARIGPSDCLKTDSRDHKYCKVTPNEIPPLCSIKIWDRPWLPHGRETNVTCNQSTQTYRTRRSVGNDTPGGIRNISVRDPKVLELVEHTLTQMDKESTLTVKYVASEILAASEQTVSGVRYSIEARIGPSDCLKTDSRDHKYCKVTPNEIPPLCSIKIWDRPWLPHGRETNVTCNQSTQTYRTRRSVGNDTPGGIRNISVRDPKVLELVEHTLTQMDKESTLTVKYVASEILAASEQTVSGVRYSIDARIGPSDCLKTDSRDHKYCKVTPNEIPPLCNIKIWDRPWLPHGRETNVTCNQSTQTYSN